MKLTKIAYFGPVFVLTAVIILFWELTVRLGIISSYFLPSPSAVTYALFSNWSTIYPHTLQTLTEALTGLIIAVVLGIIISILLDISMYARRSIYPLLITSQTVPMIALAPLLLLWFGVDILPKIIIVVLYCFFPVVISLADGFSQTDPQFINLLKTMGATYWQIVTIVKIPNALPSFFSGLKIAVTYSITAAIVGEYVGAYQGLGIYMQEMANSHAIELVFAAIAVTALLSLSLFIIVCIVERFFESWKYQSSKKTGGL